MRKLLLIAMVACLASLTTGCIISSGDDDGGGDIGFITADWDFHTVSGSTLGCPTGFNTAAVTATPVGGGTAVIDLYDCVAQTGRADYPVDSYDVDIDITSDGGGSVYASSLTERVDIIAADAAVGEDFIDDGGRFLLDWVLVSASNAPLTCAQAGAVQVGYDGTPGGGLPPVTEDFPCNDGTAVSKPMLSQSYTLAFDALDSSGGGTGGSSTTKTGVVIADPNGYTDLGTVMILAQ